MIIYDLIRLGTSPGAQETTRDLWPRRAGTINEIVMGGILGCWKSFENTTLLIGWNSGAIRQPIDDKTLK